MLKDFNFDIKILPADYYPMLMNAVLTTHIRTEIVYFQMCELIAQQRGKSVKETEQFFDKLFQERVAGLLSEIAGKGGSSPQATISPSPVK